MPREPLSDTNQGLLDDPCHFVRRACQLADYGDPAQDAAVVPSTLEQPAAGETTCTAAHAALHSAS